MKIILKNNKIHPLFKFTVQFSLCLFLLAPSLSSSGIIEKTIKEQLEEKKSRRSSKRVKSSVSSQVSGLKESYTNRARQRRKDKKIEKKFKKGAITEEQYRDYHTTGKWPKFSKPNAKKKDRSAEEKNNSEISKKSSEKEDIWKEIPRIRKELIPIKRKSKKTAKKPVNGKFTKFYSSGNIYAEEHYMDGKRDGICKYYYRNGKVRKEVLYQQNIIEKVLYAYDRAGNLL